MPTLPLVSSVLSHFDSAALWTAPAEVFHSFAHWAAPAAVTALWQGAMVAAGLALCVRLVPRVAAAHRFAAWAAGFGVLVALPFAAAAAHLFALRPGSEFGFDSAASLPSTSHPWLSHPSLAHPLLNLSDRWSLAIAALWVVVALVRAVDLLVHTVRLRRLWKSATPVAMPQNLAAALCASLDSETGKRRTKFELCTTRELDRPSVIGFFAPRILIPDWLFEKLTRQELEQVVLHESEHLRRRDDWTNLLQKLCLVVFPLNPALAFVERRLCREREMACDEGVVRRTQAPRAYAACLAGLAERHIQHRAEALSLGARAKALTLSAYERRPELARRVHSILVRRSAMHPLAGRALLGAVGCVLAIGAVELARCPQLVAFVPSAPKVTAETAQMVPEQLRGDKVFLPTDATPAGSHFRAINTMAILPQTVRQRIASGEASSHASNHRATASEPYSQAPGTSILRSAIHAAQAVKSSSPGVVADNVRAVAPLQVAPLQSELIVFTTYEQVQASGGELGDKVISDYDSETAANAKPGPAGQITITRLIFRVYPAGLKAATAIPVLAIKPGTAAQSAAHITSEAAGEPANQAAHPHANFPASQFHAVALGNGWFVIQL